MDGFKLKLQFNEGNTVDLSFKLTTICCLHLLTFNFFAVTKNTSIKARKKIYKN